MSEKLYADRAPWDLEPWYSRHVGAMTEESLHSKAAIAAELAYRDQQIERLTSRLDDALRDLKGTLRIIAATCHANGGKLYLSRSTLESFAPGSEVEQIQTPDGGIMYRVVERQGTK